MPQRPKGSSCCAPPCWWEAHKSRQYDETAELEGKWLRHIGEVAVSGQFWFYLGDRRQLLSICKLLKAFDKSNLTILSNRAHAAIPKNLPVVCIADSQPPGSHTPSCLGDTLYIHVGTMSPSGCRRSWRIWMLGVANGNRSKADSFLHRENSVPPKMTTRIKRSYRVQILVVN